MRVRTRTAKHERVAHSRLPDRRRRCLVVQNTLMVRITQSASTILIAMLLNSLVGIVIFVTMLLLRQGVAGFQELALSVKWWTLIPGLLGSFFVFASISGYQNVGAATTIAVLVVSQLVAG
ncbi:Inner membrane protein ydcZ [Serratia liquefaciens]|nr:Inner membrane protein ydcZ [Serratia liquefaciens]